MGQVTRFGVSMDATLLKKFDAFIHRREYAKRSEAIRDLVRSALIREEWNTKDSEVVGTITIIYDHHVRGLQETLTELQHGSQKSVLSTMHIHLDAHNCLEVLAVRGKVGDIQNIADRLISLKGVKHGKLVATSTGKDLA
ncbi:MAG: nickel-responsive transcriptional regulator NikR [Gemmatimonadota bacterium]|nr:MAG: nickel-responsive transcriptional regulator NikR [Gemmatimonadota bacterium]